MRQKISVRAIIKVDEKLLLLRRAQGNPKYIGQYELSGGKVEFGEDPEAALRRELSEELGVAAGAVQIFKIVSWLDAQERDTQHIILVYLVGLLNEHSKIVLSEEHDRFIWRKLSDIQLNELNALTRVVLVQEKAELPTDPDQVPEGKKVVSSTSSGNNKEVIIYSDGGSRGNPGPSASGFVVFTQEGDLIFEGGKYLGITTNNQAEYQAVKLGLEKALEVGARIVNFRLDSQLVANQLVGLYQVKNRDLWPIHASIQDLIQQFDKVTFTHVRREFNQEADAMVNKILDQHR
jgi:ribonuclease HI